MSNKSLVIIGVVVLLGIAVLVFLFTREGEDTNTTNDTTVNTEETAGTNGNGNDTAVQFPNRVILAETTSGQSATVESVTLDKPGYVVLYQVNSNSEASLIGESELLQAGTHTNIRLGLSSTIAKDQTVVAVLHADDGDGEFEVPGSDGYLTNPNGTMATDVDIVDVRFELEDKQLQEQIDTYFENNATTSASLN